MTPEPADLERRLMELLIEHGGPPDLAPQIAAMLREHHAPAAVALDWIYHHPTGAVWCCTDFAAHLLNYSNSVRHLKDPR